MFASLCTSAVRLPCSAQAACAVIDARPVDAACADDLCAVVGGKCKGATGDKHICQHAMGQRAPRLKVVV